MGTGLAERLGGLGGTGMFARGSDEAAARAEAEPEKPVDRRTNVYAGDCRHCGNNVEPGDGYIEREGGRWVVEHIKCPNPQMFEESDGAEVVSPEAKGRTIEDYPAVVLPGIYTMEVAPSGGHRTFKVVLQPDDAKFAPGQVLIEYLSGSDNEGDYTTFGFIKGDKLVPWKKHRDNSGLLLDAREFLADPYNENVLAAIYCLAGCGNLLTHPDSVKLGMGPYCAKKGW